MDETVVVNGVTYPDWQGTIRRAQFDAQSAAKEKANKADAEKAESDHQESKRIADLLERLTLPRGVEKDATRIVGQYVFSVGYWHGRKLYISRHGTPAMMELLTRYDLMDGLMMDMEIKDVMTPGHDAEERPVVTLTGYEPASDTLSAQVRIADCFDQLEANYKEAVDAVDRINAGAPATAPKALSENEKIAKLVRELIIEVLEAEGIVY